jgi:hypothetical protein
MQKLSGTSSGKNNKSCSIFHHESKKIEFAFFWIFYNVLRNLQESTKLQILLKLYFAAGTLEVLDSYTDAPTLRFSPQK